MDLKDHLTLTLLPWQALIGDWWVPCISLGGLFKKNGGYASLFPVSGIFTSLPQLLEYGGSWLRSFSCQFPQDLRLELIRSHGFLGWSQTRSSPVVGSSSFSQSLPLSPGTHAVQLEHLLVKAEAKILSSISVLSISQVSWFPVSFQWRPTFF